MTLIVSNPREDSDILQWLRIVSRLICLRVRIKVWEMNNRVFLLIASSIVEWSGYDKHKGICSIGGLGVCEACEAHLSCHGSCSWPDSWADYGPWRPRSWSARCPWSLPSPPTLQQDPGTLLHSHNSGPRTFTSSDIQLDSSRGRETSPGKNWTHTFNSPTGFSAIKLETSTATLAQPRMILKYLSELICIYRVSSDIILKAVNTPIVHFFRAKIICLPFNYPTM